MKIDMSYQLTKEQLNAFLATAKDASFSKFGHFGTHFDIEDKELPIEYCISSGIIFDVSQVPTERDIDCGDIDMEKIHTGDAVFFRTGMIERHEYGSDAYFHEHPQLSQELIRKLADKGIRMICMDMAGVRRGKEHAPADRYCADHGVFNVENIINMDVLLSAAPEGRFTAYVFPLNIAGYTGIPSRVIAEI